MFSTKQSDIFYNDETKEMFVCTVSSFSADKCADTDELVYGAVPLIYKIDKNTNYKRRVYPESLAEFQELREESILGVMGKSTEDIYSDGTLQILSSNLVPKFQVVFNDLFPYSLSTVTFDATDTDIEYFTADVSFKYTIYQITDLSNNPL